VKKGKSLAICALSLVMVLVLFGCGSNNNSASPTASSKGSAVSGGAKKKVAVLLFTRKFEFMVGLEKGAKEAAERLGVEVTILDGNATSQTQLSQIEDQLAKKVDAIVLSPNNSDELVPGVKKANAANVPVVTLDGIVTPGQVEIYGEVRFDNFAGGKAAADFMAKFAKPGTALELTGPLGHQHARQRHDGFADTLKALGGFTINTKDVEFDTDKAQAAAATVLTADKNVTAIVSETDGMNPGVISALKQVNKLKKAGEDGHIFIVGVDGTADALEQIRQGQIDGTISQDPIAMGARAVEMAVDAINGKAAPTEPFLMQPTLVTKENVDDPNNWGNKMK
jgi:ribose transport system substrate-binding protein